MRNKSSWKTNVAIIGGALIAFLLIVAFIESSPSAKDPRQKNKSQYSYADWKRYIDLEFAEWCDNGKEMTDFELQQMYISSGWTKELRMEESLEAYANLKQTEVDELKGYANGSCKTHVAKINELWDNNEVNSKPNRYK